jgi:hemerythrin-like domain-containing protein
VRALDILVAEHREIADMLVVLEAIAAQLETGREVPETMIDGVLEFFERFADACHHAKEERRLFPLLATERGLGAEAETITALVAQHDSGRSHVRDMRAEFDRLRDGDPLARTELASTARVYVEQLREHIRIEDEHLCPLLAEALSPMDDEILCRHFEEIDRTRSEPGDRERYRRMLDQYRRIVAWWTREPAAGSAGR